MRRALWATGLVAACLVTAPPVRAAISAAGFTETSVATGLGPITGLAWAPDGSQRLFLTRQTGEILIVQEGKLVKTPFATVSPIVAQGELGLLGIAFDPSFGSNGYVYVFATVSTSEQQILRYTANGNVGSDPVVIIPKLPTRGANHNGGAIGFGADGKLYWAVGDNGTQLGAGNDLFLLNAKVGRANPDGTVPDDNPFSDGAGPNNDYIWARGFRNPFTFTFQPSTGQLWLNVVGTYYEQVFQVSAGAHGGWADYESDQPAGYLAPAIAYETGAIETHTVPSSGTARLGGRVTLYTSDAHRYRPGAKVTVAGVSDASFNGDFFVSEVLASNQVSYLQAGPDAVSGNGSVSSQAIGNCITGGTFWDSTALPLDYQGNFFFGDYGSGRLMRATLDASNHVASVQEFGSGVTNVVDLDVGPDGDLYYVTQKGSLFRGSYTPSEQALVVSRKNVRLAEGGTAAFDVRLAVAPPAARGVLVGKSGDADVTLTSATTLTFTPENWMVPQLVTLAAAPDADSMEDVARVRVASSGLAENVDVWVTDAQPSSFLLSDDHLDLEEGQTTDLQVSLTQRPDETLVVLTQVVGDDSALQVTDGAELSFLPRAWNAPQSIQLQALQDEDAEDEIVTLRLVGRGPVRSREVSILVHDDDKPGLGGGGEGGGSSSGGAAGGAAGPEGDAGQNSPGAAGTGAASSGATSTGATAGEAPDGEAQGGARSGDGGHAATLEMGPPPAEKGCNCAVAHRGESAADAGTLLLGLGFTYARRRSSRQFRAKRRA